jgi:hypothetical protein
MQSTSEGFMRIATVSLPVVVLGIANMLGAAQQTPEGTASNIPTREMQLLSGGLGARFRLRKPQNIAACYAQDDSVCMLRTPGTGHRCSVERLIGAL